jgi:hypothetical protein
MSLFKINDTKLYTFFCVSHLYTCLMRRRCARANNANRIMVGSAICLSLLHILHTTPQTLVILHVKM